MYENEARFGTVFDPPIRLQAIPRIQTAQRQLSEYQEGDALWIGPWCSLLLSSNFTELVSGMTTISLYLFGWWETYSC